MANRLITNRTATVLGVHDVDASHVVVGAMGGQAIVDPDAASINVLSVLKSSGDIESSTPAAPENTVAPVISGDAEGGATLTVTPGTWTGNPTPDLTYQWLADDVEIEGATDTTYVLTEAEVDAMITVEETATNLAGTESETSVAVGPVTAEGA